MFWKEALSWVIAILTDKSIKLEMEYQISLAKINTHLVSLQVLHETSFLIMHVDESNAKSKAKGGLGLLIFPT